MFSPSFSSLSLPLVQRHSSHRIMAFLCCAGNDGVPFFEQHSGEQPQLPCFISHGSIFSLGYSSFHQSSWCKIQLKNGCGILFRRKVNDVGAVCKPTKREKNKPLQDLFRRQKALKPQRDRNATTVGPLLLGFFLFVVVGSAFLQIIRSASMGGAQGPPPQ